MKRFTLLLLAISFVLSGCLKTRSEMNEDDERKVMQTQLTDIQQSRADTQSRLNDIDAEIRKLNGRVEVVESKSLQSSVNEDQKSRDYAQRINDLEQKNKILADALEKLEIQIQGLATEVKTSPVAQEAPKASQVGNFAIAEGYFKKKEWKPAIVAYQKYRDLNPKGKDYAEASYKIGVCFEEMKMKSEAKAFYDEVIEKFPKTVYAQKSKFRLKKLK